MPTTKPTKPSITLPSAFGTSVSNVKTPFTAQELIDGYSASIQQVLDGGNVNWLNDTLFKYLTYTTSLCDWLNGTGVRKIPFVNSSNQLDYMDAPTGAVIGQIISLVCTADYIPDGCLPCDGQEYAKAMFEEFWTNYLASSPVLLLVCSYADYASDISTYGQCGKFAIDNVNETFKVPTIKDGSYLTQAKSDSELGKAYNESLPNIKGDFWADDAASNRRTASGAFTRKSTASLNSSGGGGWQDVNIEIDASRVSSTYQNDAPVQGNNVRVRYFVVVSNGQQNQAQMDWSAWASSLNNKANKDADNLSSQGKSYLAGLGMPSDTYEDLTYATSSFYTAPANGYVVIDKIVGDGSYLFCASYPNDYTGAVGNVSAALQTFSRYKTTGNNDSLSGIISVKKGDKFGFEGNANGTTRLCRFVYAEGEV